MARRAQSRTSPNRAAPRGNGSSRPGELANPTLPPFEPAEVQEIRDAIERAVGKVAEEHGLRLQYDDTAATEKVIPIRFKLTRRAPEQRDLFGNPKRTGTAGPRGERLRAVRATDLAPEMIVVRVPYLVQDDRRVPIERYQSPPPQRMHVEAWDPKRDRARLVDMDTHKVWTHPPSAYPSVLLVEADTIHDAAVRVANPTQGAELFDQLQEGTRVQVKTKSYGPRVVTVRKGPDRGSSSTTFFVTSGKTMRENFRGGIIQRWDSDPNELLYQPTYTQQIERIQTLEIVGMAHNPTDRLAQRLATGHTR